MNAVQPFGHCVITAAHNSFSVSAILGCYSEKRRKTPNSPHSKSGNPIIAKIFLQERSPGRDSCRGTALLQLNAKPHFLLLGNLWQVVERLFL